MTAAQFRAAWEASGLPQADYALALGYRSPDRKNLRQQINDMACGRKPIPPRIARLVEMFRRHGIPPEWISEGDDAP
jgi:hypothetical protein